MSTSPAPPGNDPQRFVPKPPGPVAAAAARADELQRAASGTEPANPPAGQPEHEPPAPVPGAQPITPGVTTPAAEPSGQRDFERDFNAMKGRYEREQAAAKQLAERVQGLETLLAQVTTQPPPAVEGQTPIAFERAVTPELEQEYGKEFLEVVGKKAKDEIIPELVQLRQDIQYLKNGMSVVGTSIAKSSEDRMYDMLDSVIGPEWEQINEDPRYHEWLAVVDPYAGRRRRDMLQEAFTRHDGPRVVTFFQGYKTEAAVLDPLAHSGAPSPTPLPNGAAANGKVPLESFAAPGRAGPAAQDRPADKPTYSRSDIANFYRDKAGGKWRGREAEAAAIDADIIAAGREGRVT